MTPQEIDVAIYNDLAKENAKLKEEIQTLKDNIEFLNQVLDDREKSIYLMQQEKNKWIWIKYIWKIIECWILKRKVADYQKRYCRICERFWKLSDEVDNYK